MVFVFSLLVIIPMRLVVAPEISDEAFDDPGNLHYLYIPFVSIPDAVRIESHLSCSKGGYLIINGWIILRLTRTKSGKVDLSP